MLWKACKFEEEPNDVDASSDAAVQLALEVDGEMRNDADEEDVGSDDDEWRGIASDPTSQDEHRSGTKPHKPPTGEEIRVIKDATDLFRSTSFKLQVSSCCITVMEPS